MITKEMSEQQALQRLAALCSRGEHCSFEMEEKMRRWGIGEEARSHILERLVKDRYVDDSRYCRYFVEDKIRFNKWGRRKIEQALWAKRIPEDIYREVLDSVDEEEYVRMLKPLLQNKRRSMKADTSYELNMKLTKFALGRGFTMDVIRKCIDCDEVCAED